MKRKSAYYFLIGVCLLSILGCQPSSEENQVEPFKSKNNDVEKSDEGEESIMGKYDIFEFKHIDKAPEATEKHPINNVIKNFFDEWSIISRLQ
ncbi:hypothetical protein [Pseudogracilibacillus sp. SO30301A]|uniref:hypothetical protein n=1 Tax=Pseudogracilibacillus sp. SO30301A TaxID=3098291 RepID=UPI00300E2CDF